jgi:hypothetical protein
MWMQSVASTSYLHCYVIDPACHKTGRVCPYSFCFQRLQATVRGAQHTLIRIISEFGIYRSMLQGAFHLVQLLISEA